MKSKRLWLRDILPFALGVVILFILIIKAIRMQVTCDEAYTVQTLAPQPVWDLISYKDSYTNNHIFNTLLVKGLFSLFGMNHSLARVPNIAAFILYFYFIYRFSKSYISEGWVSLMFIVVMICNPYLLDFFALARGYGLAIGLMMGSIYFAARYLLDGNSKSLPLSILMAILSVYAQFAMLHFYLGLNLLLVVFQLIHYSSNKNIKPLLYGLGIQAAGLAVLISLIYLPITAILRDNQIAYYGTDGFWQDTLSSLIFNSVYAQGYFSGATLNIFKGLTLFLFLLVAFYFLWLFVKKEIVNSENTYPSVFAALLFICTTLSVILQFHLLGNQYVQNRTALFFYPLLAMLMPIVAVWSFQYRKKLGVTVSVIFIVFSLNHVKRGYSFSKCREWWYDAHTYEILDFLKAQYDKSDEKRAIRFNMTWTFNPSFRYHIEKGNMTSIATLRFNRQTDTTNVYDFYYCTRDELPALEKQYEKIKEWDSGQWILMKRRVDNSSFLK